MDKAFVVHAFGFADDDFRIAGIFSLERDADQFMAAARARGEYRHVAHPQQIPMDAILDALVRDRLRELAEPIQALAASIAGASMPIRGAEQGTPLGMLPHGGVDG